MCILHLWLVYICSYIPQADQISRYFPHREIGTVMYIFVSLVPLLFTNYQMNTLVVHLKNTVKVYIEIGPDMHICMRIYPCMTIYAIEDTSFTSSPLQGINFSLVTVFGKDRCV